VATPPIIKLRRFALGEAFPDSLVMVPIKKYVELRRTPIVGRSDQKDAMT
jgi:hypothetical protein